MGMLVDNAIVVTDNAQVGIKRGLSRYQALVDGATKPQWALLGATFIAVCFFLADVFWRQLRWPKLSSHCLSCLVYPWG